MIGARIASLGVSLPERELHNSELAARLGVTESWIETRTGIVARRVAAEDETTATLGAEAARRALSAAHLDPSEVDLIICATISAGARFPATASLIQSAIGAPAAAFDLNAGCSGFLFALSQATAAIGSGAAQRVLVVGADTLTRLTDYDDPQTAILFGDGAGCALVERCEEDAYLGPFWLFSDGARPELLFVDDRDLIRMNGREVYRAAVEGMSASVTSLLSAAGTRLEDVDLLVAHQANARILAAVGQRLGLDPAKTVSNIARYGNTSAASIPVALAEAEASGRLHEGDVVVLTAFGAGFAWGAGMLRWGTGRVEPFTEVTARVAVG